MTDQNKTITPQRCLLHNELETAKRLNDDSSLSVFALALRRATTSHTSSHSIRDKYHRGPKDCQTNRSPFGDGYSKIAADGLLNEVWGSVLDCCYFPPMAAKSTELLRPMLIRMLRLGLGLVRPSLAIALLWTVGGGREGEGCDV